MSKETTLIEEIEFPFDMDFIRKVSTASGVTPERIKINTKLLFNILSPEEKTLYFLLTEEGW